MGANENLDLHRRWIDAERAKDLSQLADFLHRDFELRVGGADPIVGIDAYRAMRLGAFDALPDEQLIIDDLFASDDRSVCRWRMSGTLAGDPSETSEYRQPVELAGVSVYEVADGRLRQGWIFQGPPRMG